MLCKNCEIELQPTTSFCGQCGAKVVKNRISLNQLWKSLINDFFGFDNRYFRTVKDLTTQPGKVLREYLNGTRKKYLAPFAFLAIGTAISMLVFTQFADEYIQMSASITESQYDLMVDYASDIEGKKSLENEKDIQVANSIEAQHQILKYFNIFTFLLIPLYAFISFLVFWKPQNYAEHLVLACYIQGYTFLFSVLLFIVSLLIHPTIYYLAIPLTMAYYLYAYGQLNQYSFSQKVLKFLKFVGIIVVGMALSGIVGFLIGALTSSD